MSQLAEIAMGAVTGALNSVHVALPGKVIAFYSERNTADVEIGVRLPVEHFDSDLEMQDLGVVYDAPILYPAGGGFSIVFPLNVGDSVMLLFSDIPAGEWFESDGSSPTEPQDLRRHSLGYPVIFPGGRPVKKVQNAPSNSLKIGSEMGAGVISLQDAQIQIGKNASEFVALSTKIDSFFSSIVAAFNAHGHPAFTAPPAPVPGVIPLVNPGSVAATLTKAK